MVPSIRVIWKNWEETSEFLALKCSLRRSQQRVACNEPIFAIQPVVVVATDTASHTAGQRYGSRRSRPGGGFRRAPYAYSYDGRGDVRRKSRYRLPYTRSQTRCF